MLFVLLYCKFKNVVSNVAEGTDILVQNTLILYLHKILTAQINVSSNAYPNLIYFCTMCPRPVPVFKKTGGR